MSHREPNDFGPGEHPMDRIPGYDDLDPEASDTQYDLAVYEGSLIDDCRVVAAMESLMQPLPEPVATGAWIEINKTFSEKQADAMAAEQDHVARFYRRKAV